MILLRLGRALLSGDVSFARRSACTGPVAPAGVGAPATTPACSPAPGCSAPVEQGRETSLGLRLVGASSAGDAPAPSSDHHGDPRLDRWPALVEEVRLAGVLLDGGDEADFVALWEACGSVPRASAVLRRVERERESERQLRRITT